MGFRTIVIKSRAKLDLQLNYLVCRGESEQRVFLSEINTLIIQSTAVAITAALLCEMVKRNIKVIFCDEKCSPHSELLPYYGCHNSSGRIKQQIEWDTNKKGDVWAAIIKRKIEMQAKNLLNRGFYEESELLFDYSQEVCSHDITNREGHAAKVYFNKIFGDGFTRHQRIALNGYLNYGYAIIMSAFNREIVAQGHLTQIGIWHKNEFNDFNLSCDLMEPFRPIVDDLADSLEDNDKNFKLKMVDVLNKKTVIKKQTTTLDNAIKIYTRSVLNALSTGKTALINFVEKYEL